MQGKINFNPHNARVKCFFVSRGLVRGAIFSNHLTSAFSVPLWSGLLLTHQGLQILRSSAGFTPANYRYDFTIFEAVIQNFSSVNRDPCDLPADFFSQLEFYFFATRQADE